MNRLLWLCSIMILLLVTVVGCSNKNIPEGFSEQTYQDFTEIYDNYLKAKPTLSRVSESKGTKGYGDLWEYRKKNERGELTKVEVEVLENFQELFLIYNTLVVKKENKVTDEKVAALNDWVAEDEYKIPALEESIETLLQLPKTKKTDRKKPGGQNKKQNSESTSDVSAENCPAPYTKEDCAKFEEYYKNGEGRFEPGK
ncbi:hypothetical protein [Bacillus cereus]|uniref:hypothetical protein n=1 Tax=Bacillus cereus TaxID=1396 RepID=UPI000B4AF290|nr:hypothetical protein [Bacillus cereus]